MGSLGETLEWFIVAPPMWKPIDLLTHGQGILKKAFVNSSTVWYTPSTTDKVSKMTDTYLAHFLVVHCHLQ